MTETQVPLRLRRAALIPMVAAASMVLFGCSSASDSTTDGGSSTNGSEGGFQVIIDDCEDPAAAQALIEETFTIGYSAPLSGPVAGVVELASDGYKSRVAQANNEGEIDGVEIVVDYKDDAFTPDKAKSNGVEFLQRDKVDALNTFGAGQVSAIADDQNAACVPLLYPSSSDSQFNEIENYPWTVQFLPSADAETKFIVQYIVANTSDPKIGVVANATASGEAMAASFVASAEEAGLEIIVEADDTDPNAAATTMKEAGATVIFHAGVVGSCGVFDTAMDRIGYKPDLVTKASNCVNSPEYIAAGEAADGVVIASYLKDPSSPDFANDPGVLAYLETVEGVADPNNAVTISGYMQAELLVNTLKQAAESDLGLTRESIILAARDQNYAAPMLLDGITWKSTADRPAGVSGFAPIKWSFADQRFVSAGDVIQVD
ncbi:MAG: ABC transporter substrate-binding protein [Leucobacter sp.]|nr:ABC transporter substrate-binding protein [Leucobacter sp.]